MDQLPAYLTGGGLITALAGVMWKFLAVTAKALSDENKRLAARIVVLEVSNQDYWDRTRNAEQAMSTLAISSAGVLADLALALKHDKQQAAELALALKNVSDLTLELSKSVRSSVITSE